MELKFKLLNPTEVWQILPINLNAFGPSEGKVLNQLVPDLANHPAGSAGALIAAELDGELVGYVMLSEGLLDAPTKLFKVGVLGPLAVLERLQRQGIGQALVERLISEAEKRNYPIVFLEGDPQYYSRLGFVPGGPLGFRKPSLRIPDEAFQCRLLSGYENSMTGTEIYPEPFWTHDCVGLR